MTRQDYAFPFRIDPISGQAANCAYEVHVEQMIRQILLTSPGERINLPDFGCGVRKLVFAPNSDALAATAKMMIMQSLLQWLGSQIQVKDVQVSQPEPSQLFIVIEYVLIETQTQRSLSVQVI